MRGNGRYAVHHYGQEVIGGSGYIYSGEQFFNYLMADDEEAALAEWKALDLPNSTLVKVIASNEEIQES